MWDMLGIPPTGDKKEIKRAYSRQLRNYHPEEDPEGFQRLREAYERALRHVDLNGKGPTPAPQPIQNTPTAEVILEGPLQEEVADKTAAEDTPPCDPEPASDTEFQEALDLLRLAVETEEAMPHWSALLDRVQDMPLSKRSHFEFPLVFALLQPSRLDPAYCNLAVLPRWYRWSLDELFHWREENLHLDRLLDVEEFERLLHWVLDLETVTTGNILEDMEDLMLDPRRGADPANWHSVLKMLDQLDIGLRRHICHQSAPLLLAYLQHAKQTGKAHIPRHILFALAGKIGWLSGSWRRYRLMQKARKIGIEADLDALNNGSDSTADSLDRSQQSSLSTAQWTGGLLISAGRTVFNYAWLIVLTVLVLFFLFSAV